GRQQRDRLSHPSANTIRHLEYKMTWRAACDGARDMKRALIRGFLIMALSALAGACDATPTAGAGDDLTSVGGTPKTIDWDSFVYASPQDDDAAIQRNIQRQVKSSLGALREKSIGIS